MHDDAVLEAQYLQLLIDDIRALNDQFVKIATTLEPIPDERTLNALNQIREAQKSLRQMMELIRGRVEVLTNETP